MLGMIANDVEIYESENLYEIYQKFVENKIEIWKKVFRRIGHDETLSVICN